MVSTNTERAVLRGRIAGCKEQDTHSTPGQGQGKNTLQDCCKLSQNLFFGILLFLACLGVAGVVLVAMCSFKAFKCNRCWKEKVVDKFRRKKKKKPSNKNHKHGAATSSK